MRFSVFCPREKWGESQKKERGVGEGLHLPHSVQEKVVGSNSDCKGRHTPGNMLRKHETGASWSDIFARVTCPFLGKSSVSGTKCFSAHHTA